MTIQKGDTVFYNIPRGEHMLRDLPNGEQLVAIVTHLTSQDDVNLTILPDASRPYYRQRVKRAKPDDPEGVESFEERPKPQEKATDGKTDKRKAA